LMPIKPLSNPDMLLQIKELFKAYGRKGSETYQVVLDDVSLDIDRGQRIAVTGPSGSGKTTLLNMAGSLDKPDRGQVLYRDQDITGLSGKGLEQFRNQAVGFVFQQHHLLPQFTLFENVLLPTLPNRGWGNALARAEDLVRRTGLWDHRHKKPGELSGGESQRTAVVRALINNPAVLLADEPTGSLDHENSNQLFDMLIELSSTEEVALVVVTHSLELAGRMDTVYRLKSGKLDMITAK
jgi:lipoprotein-releasing system ATP-binding protein